MKTVQTILDSDEYQDTKSASESALAGTAPTSSSVLPVHSLMDDCNSRQMKGSVFKYFNCHFQGRPRPEPWRSWRDLILQRVPAVVTSPNGASPQSKHCNPPIPSHSRINQLVPLEYGGNLVRGKIGTQPGDNRGNFCVAI